MKDILNHLFESNTLTKQQAYEVLKNIAETKYSENQVSAFLTVYRMRSITVEELEGFRDAMLDLCLSIDFSEYDLIDLCGTGGDNKHTINISTLASFVVAGAGIKVAKHGNYGVSSFCGSSNVLEHLGVKFTSDKDKLRKQIETAGLCVLHAPLFHPAMKNVVGIRRDLAFKTFFNILGPMVNPTTLKYQMVGVFSLEVARIYSYIYQKSSVNFTIVHSLDGYDEVSLTSPFKIITREKEELQTPFDIGFSNNTPAEISGGKSIDESAKMFMSILKGQGTQAQNNVTIANAAMSIHCAKSERSMEDCVDLARNSLMSGKALHSFNLLIANN